MKRVAAICALLLFVVPQPELRARAFEVRPLDPKNPAVWGTDEFQVSVDAIGCVSHVKVKGREVIWQAARLYTAPMPPGKTGGLRKVQGEGPLDKMGLSIDPPKTQNREEEGKRIFEYEHVLATRQVLDGRPLARVREKITVSPTGEIGVLYDCEWLETLAWEDFMHLVIFDGGSCQDREYVIKVKDRFYTGKPEKTPPAEHQLYGLPFDRFSIRTEVGPVHFVWEGESSCAFFPTCLGARPGGGGGPTMYIMPKSTPRHATCYKGQKDRLSYRILLPVSQQ
jgi:hypothetical protein